MRILLTSFVCHILVFLLLFSGSISSASSLKNPSIVNPTKSVNLLFPRSSFPFSSSNSIQSLFGNLDAPAPEVLPTVASGLGTTKTIVFPVGCSDFPRYLILFLDIVFIIFSYEVVF